MINKVTMCGEKFLLHSYISIFIESLFYTFQINLIPSQNIFNGLFIQYISPDDVRSVQILFMKIGLTAHTSIVYLWLPLC